VEQTAEIMTVSKKFSQTLLPSAIGQQTNDKLMPLLEPLS